LARAREALEELAMRLEKAIASPLDKGTNAHNAIETAVAQLETAVAERKPDEVFACCLLFRPRH
jgi:hypothetical protein